LQETGVSIYKEGLGECSKSNQKLRAENLVGPNTISDPDANTNSKQFNAFLYNRRIILREVQGSESGLHRVRCCHCFKVWSDRKPTDTSTTVYIRHIREKHKGIVPADEKEEKEMLAALTARGTKRRRTDCSTLITPWTLTQRRQGGEAFTEETYRELLLHFLIETNTPFRVAESKSFHKLMSYLNSKVPSLSTRTIVRDLHKLHKSILPGIKTTLAAQIQSGGRIHITLDCWSASNGTPYLGITAHWLDRNWRKPLHDVVLDLVRLRGSHTAANLTDALLKTLRNYSIGKALGCVTCDNAAVMPALCRALEDEIPGWKKKDGHVRCMAHIINLAAQKILGKLRCQRDDNELDADLAEAEGVEGPGVGEASPEIVLKKVRCVVAKVRASHNLAEALEREATAVNLKYLRPKMDMRVR
jgi:hypothetical protein